MQTSQGSTSPPYSGDHLSRAGQQWGTGSQPCAVLPWAFISLFIWYAQVQRFYGKSGKQNKVHPKSLISISSCHLKEQLPQFLFVHLASDFMLLKICSLTKPYDCHSSPCLLAGDGNPRSPRALSVTDCLSQQGSGEGSAGQASARQPGVLTQDWLSVSRGRGDATNLAMNYFNEWIPYFNELSIKSFAVRIWHTVRVFQEKNVFTQKSGLCTLSGHSCCVSPYTPHLPCEVCIGQEKHATPTLLATSGRQGS